VSFTGGFQGDLIEFRLPETHIWGVRGEMALGLTDTIPHQAYIWAPDSVVALMVGVEAGNPQGLALYHIDETGAATLVATPVADPTGRPARLIVNDPVPDSLYRLSIPDFFDATGALIVEGAPGLLCPSADAARILHGGAVKSHGLWTGGPLQARARDWMVMHLPEIHRDAVAAWNVPDDIPEEISSDPQALAREALGYGKYFAPLNNLEHMIELQNDNLDPDSPFFGWTWTSPPARLSPNWTNFLPADKASVRIPSALAAAWSIRSPLNPAGGSEELSYRATFSAMANIVSLQGDDLVRERTLLETRYPMLHAFFVYLELAETLALLEESSGVPPDAEEIWCEAAMAVGDKLADFKSYMSNQWLHIILAHLQVYRATGEERFLEYFEQQMACFLEAGDKHPDGKFGQHPSGFYLENYGPDGSYDGVNAAYMAACYQIYRDLPEASAELVSGMHRAIEKNLRLRSFFWLPQPDGSVASPSSVCTRKTIPYGNSIWGADYITRSSFPLGAARAALLRAPDSGVGKDATNASYVANTPEWIRRVVAEGVRRGYGAWKYNYGNLYPHLLRAYEIPQTATPARLPFQEENEFWTLPGVQAWNYGGLYGVVFYDVVGARRTLDNYMGGGPTVLWRRELGSFINGSAPSTPSPGLSLTSSDELVFSCVFGQHENGELYYTGKERSVCETDDSSDSSALRFVIRSEIKDPAGSLAWRYSIGDQSLEIGVGFALEEAVDGVFLNLPLTAHKGVDISYVSPNRVIIQRMGGDIENSSGVIIEWPKDFRGELMPSVDSSTVRLVVEMPNNGEELVLRFTRLE
jgi:hypothetical protein